MDNSLLSDVISCTQCGGELHPDEGQIFLTCPYCNSTVYLDKSRVVFHWYIAPTLDEAKAQSSLARWMAGSQTVKDLDKKARLSGVTFEYFPVWFFKRRRQGNKEEILLEPAAATSVSEIRRLNLPAGDLRKYETSLDAQVRQPSVPLQAVLKWLAERQVPAAEIAEQALVHIPLFLFKYQYQGKMYTAIVEGATGGVFANIYPSKSEAPYLLAGGITAAVFLCLAAVPLAGAMMDTNAFGIGMLVCLGLGIVVVPILLALAAWVAAKI